MSTCYIVVVQHEVKNSQNGLDDTPIVKGVYDSKEEAEKEKKGYEEIYQRCMSHKVNVTVCQSYHYHYVNTNTNKFTIGLSQN